MKPPMPYQERDRFVAFAFAAADLLLELDDDQKIVAAQGATLGTTGRSTEQLVGTPFADIILPDNQALVSRLLRDLPRSGGRLAPMTLKIAHASGAQPLEVFGGCRMPTLTGRFFVTLSAPAQDLTNRPAPTIDACTGLLDRAALVKAAETAAMDEGGLRPKQLTLVRVDGFSETAGKLPAEQGSRLIAETVAVLRARSLGGDNAGRIAADIFGIVEAGNPDTPSLPTQLREAAASAGIAAGLINPIAAMLDLSPEGMNEGDVRRAIVHAVNRTLGSGKMREGRTSLSEEFAETCKDTLDAVAVLRTRIDRREIVLAYQPVVSLATRQPHHFEALARGLDGKTATESIAFGEEVGLIAEIDLMILKMALKQLGDGPGHPVAVNISGQSVQQDRFRTEMLALLDAGGFQTNRLLFELTESSMVEKTQEVAAFLKSLRKRGHAICLDDFGAGAAAYGYLRNFEVDFVKIDGPFLQSAVESSRDFSLVASVVQVCGELKCSTIGEMIETEAQASVAVKLGIGYGQGWLYGRAIPDLPALATGQMTVGKRKGTRESWG